MTRTGLHCAVFMLAILRGSCLLAKEPIAADYQRFGEYLVGQWTWETDGASGTIEFEMSPTKRCLISLRSFGDQPAAHAIEGYDAEQRTWKRVIFWEDGRVSVAHAKIDEATNDDSLDGLTLRGETHDVDPSGFSSDSEVVYRIVDQDTWEVERDGVTIVHRRAEKK